MKKGMIKKGLEICIVLFFVGTSFSPIICGNTYLTNTSNIKEKKLLKDPPTEMWNKTFGGFLDEAGASVKQTNDGGYIITGKKITSEFTKEDVLLLKTDSNGNEIWSTTFGGSDVDFGWEVLEANDGGFVIIGTITSFGFQYGDIWLIKTNNNGVMIWNRTFGGTAADWGYSIDKTNDGGYILSGVTGSYGYGYDLWLIKTNQFGIEEWNQSFGSLDTVGEGRSVQQTEDGGFIVTGFNSPFIVDYDVWLIKTDQSGNQEWNKTFGGNNHEAGESVQQTNDGGYIISGWTSSYGNGYYDVWLIKTDQSGNEEWNKTFGDTYIDEAYCVQQTTDGGYIITGIADQLSSRDNETYLIKTDQFGNEEWSRKFGGIEPDLGYEVIETTDDGYVIVGKTKSYGNGGEDVWLLKLNSEGYVEIEIDINGGFRSSANIKNIGTATAYDVEWSIDLVGGWILIGEHKEDIIDILNPGQSKKVSQDTLFGIGINVKLEVTAGDTTKHAIAKWILGPLVLGI